MDREKKQKENENQSYRRKEPETQEQKLEKIDIKTSEKARMDAVYNQLIERENEPSSDEDSKEKIYKKKIAEKANSKRMKVETSNFVSKTAMTQGIKQSPTKKFKEDSDRNADNAKGRKRKFSVKALRKTIRNLCDEYAKDELEQMIWDVDDNMDGYISEKEFEKMYKKCIVDENEEDPKKLFYLIQFLMYDKEDKNYITIEDTLEILCVRHPNNIDGAINNIFNEEIPDPKNNRGSGKQHETLTYLQYAKRMHQLSLNKRTEISNKKKLFCNRIKEEAIKNSKG